MPKAKYTIELNEIDTSVAHTDGALFEMIRRGYLSSSNLNRLNWYITPLRSKLRELLGRMRLKRPCGVEFIKVGSRQDNIDGNLEHH